MRRTPVVTLVTLAALLAACSGSDASTVTAPASVVTQTASATGSAGPTAARPAATRSAAAAPAVAAPAVTRPAGTMCGWVSSPPSQYKHVIWIWFENKSAGSVVGSSSAPYFNTVGSKCALATNFHNISHPSLPNYLGATSGTTNGIDRDCAPNSCSSSSRSLFRQLELAGKTWKGYAESMTHNCAMYDTSPYAVRHNPPPYYTDVRTTCPKYDVPLGTTTSGALASDLAHATLPSFAFITPNLCNDMHDCSVSTGDAWLKKWLTLIVSSSTYSSGNTAIFVTFDEGSGGTHGENCASSSNNDPSCLIATYVLGPAVHPGARVSTRFTHYSMLRSTESMLGITTYLGNAATAAGLRSAFRL